MMHNHTLFKGKCSRLRSRREPPEQVNAYNLRLYVYDEAGCLISAGDTKATVAYNQLSGKYESDAYGNICSMKWNTTELEMKYDYDLLGRTTGVTTPDGKTVNYSYDKNGLLTAMEGIIKGNVNYETGESRIKSYTLENASGKVLEKTFKYNSLGNISSMEYSAGNKKTGFSYLYDNNYNITTRTALDTGKTSWFSYDKVNRLIQSQMHGAFETRDNLANGKLSQIDRDLAGIKDVETYFEVFPQNITLDTSGRSFVYDFGNDVSVNRIELFPDSYTHRVRERNIRLYYRESENSDWSEIKKWKFTKNGKNGSLTFALSEAVSARQIKVHCTWDDRNFLNVSIDSKATFKGNPQNMLRIWTLEESRIEDYEYDGNSDRKSLTENGVKREYEYYKNKEGGNTARVMSDGKWWYTYDENGNRTARGYNENPDSGEVSIDKTKEYWTYTWDLWNRLIEVRQFNAPDNAENVHVEYTYDVLNHRIERVSRTKSTVETTQYAYGRNGAMTYQKKTSGTSVTSRSFVYLNNQIAGFMDTENGTESIRYAVTDIQGSVTEVYDEDNKLLWKSGYTAFGIKAGETTNLIDFDGLYTGCDFEAETGLTYHWNRWRSEDGDSWLSQDPARDGLNWYGYAGQNPTNFIDKNGLFYYNGNGEQVSSLSGEVEKSESSSPTNNTTQEPSISGSQTEPTPDVVPDISPDDIYAFGVSLFSFKDGLRNGIMSIAVFCIDFVLGKTVNREENVDYEGSLYFQKYSNQVQSYRTQKNVITGLSIIPFPETQWTFSVVGILLNFESRDGQIISENLTGFIKGAQEEII